MQPERYIRIDYARAFFSVCVVLVHLGYVMPSLVFYKALYGINTFKFSDIINFYVLLLTVPVFFIISNYLFYQKSNDRKALLAALICIGKIAVFWIFFYAMFNKAGWSITKWFPSSLPEAIRFIFSGGDSIYYYFVSLLILTAIADWAIYLNEGFFEINPYALPTYARPTLVFLSMGILFLAIKISPKPYKAVVADE